MFHPDLYGEISGTQYETAIGPKIKRCLKVALADAVGALKGAKEGYKQATQDDGSTFEVIVSTGIGAIEGAVGASVQMSEELRAEDQQKVDERKNGEIEDIFFEDPNGGNRP